MTEPKKPHGGCVSRARVAILNALNGGHRLTKFDLEVRCHTSLRNVVRILRDLHDEKRVHIASYRRDTPHGPATAVWALGNQRDAPKPPPLTASQKRARYLAKRDVREKELKRKRAWAARKRIERLIAEGKRLPTLSTYRQPADKVLPEPIEDAA